MSDYYLETDKRILKSLQYACISNEKEHNCEKTCQSATHPRSYRCSISAGNMVYPSSGTYKMARTLKLCTEMAYGVVNTIYSYG